MTIRKREPEGNVLFREEQQLREPWIWLFFIAMAVALFVFLLVILPAQQKMSFKDFVPPVMITFAVLVIDGLLFYFMKLETVVTDIGVFVRWLPIQRRFKYFSWAQIERGVIRKLPWYMIGHHSRRIGWGEVYRMQGKMCLQLILNGRRPICIGSQKINRLAEAVEAFIELHRK